jgi:hypothetical protein
MKEFSIAYANDVFVIIRYQEQKIEEEIFYKGEGYLSNNESKFRKELPPILTFQFNRSVSSWNKRTPISIVINEKTLSPYSTQIGNNIVLGIQGHENGSDATQQIS